MFNLLFFLAVDLQTGRGLPHGREPRARSLRDRAQSSTRRSSARLVDHGERGTLVFGAGSLVAAQLLLAVLVAGAPTAAILAASALAGASPRAPPRRPCR